MTAAGMTDTPKVRFNNSVLNVPAKEEAEAADKATNAKTKADPNAGAAADEAKAPGAKVTAPAAVDAKAPAAADAKAPAAADAKAPAAAAKAPAAGEVDPATGIPVAAALVQKQDTIGEPKYDYSVYNFAHNAIYDPLEAKRQEDGPYSVNGYAAGKWALAQRNKNDISDKGIDEEVVGFVRADKNTVPHQLGRRESAYPVNGWANTPASTNGLAQRATKDIGDTNIDEEVVGFVRADKNMMPIPQFARRDTAYPVNGWSNTPASQALNQRATKDIGDTNIDEEVVGFVRADKNMMPIPQFARRDTAYPVNGWSNTPASQALNQRATKDIGDTNIDEEVVGFVRADKNMMPIPQFARRDTAYPVNGWSNTPASSALSQKRDIAQGGVEANVYDFVNDKVEALNWERRNEKFNNNGFAAAVPHWGNALAQDIGNGEVRPDVYVTVKNMVDPAAHFRSDKAPKESYEPYQGVQEPYPKGELKTKEKNPDGLDFVQTDAEFLGSPERVNVLDPIAYQTRANGNTIDGGIQIRRTTFYNKKAGLWQGENSMM